MIARCLNCNTDYEQETQGAICPHAAGGPNKGDPWPTLKQPFQETWARYERWCRAKGRYALHGDLWEGFLEGSRAFDEHLGHVGQFLSEMYATMIDPVEQPKMKVAEMCELLLKTAREHRETADKVSHAFTIIGNYCAAHDDVIDACWVAKVIEKAKPTPSPTDTLARAEKDELSFPIDKTDDFDERQDRARQRAGTGAGGKGIRCDVR